MQHVSSVQRASSSNTPSSTDNVESQSHQEMLKIAVTSAASSKHKGNTESGVLRWLKAHPNSLFIKGIVQDDAGRQIEGSIYQILLGNQDIWTLEKIHDDIIPLIHGGNAKAVEQFKEQFPCFAGTANQTEEDNLYDDRNMRQNTAIKACLDEIVAAFTEDKCPNAMIINFIAPSRARRAGMKIS